MRYKPSRQELGVIVFAICFITLAVITTAYVSGILFDNPTGSDSASYKNITATDALLTCKKQVRKEFGNRLTRQVVDDHSSRFDSTTGQHKVFLKAEIGGTANVSETSFYVSCFVGGRKGRVSEFSVHEDKEVESEAIRKDETNMFGWPK